MAMKFTEIASKLKYPIHIKSKLMTVHTDIINYAIVNFSGTLSEKRNILDIMNTVTYYYIVGDSLPISWNSKNPLVNLDKVDDSICRSTLKDLYLMAKQIEWDIDVVDDHNAASTNNSSSAKSNKKRVVSHVDTKVTANSRNSTQNRHTDKSDLYISPPIVPRFDIDNIWQSKIIDSTEYNIYKSLPEIPKRQCEISVTTDITRFTDTDLLNLFPTCFIPTRSSVMYSKVENLDFDKKLGVIIPIEGFTSDEVINNIIQYPHLFRLYRHINDQFTNFYANIEINGKLYRTIDVWNSLPESQKIPYHVDFIKEYVVRRYLMERDLRHINHTYALYGELNPYLTLFMTPQEYKDYGYSDSLKLSRMCVASRISYMQSRNPILRRLKEVNDA